MTSLRSKLILGFLAVSALGIALGMVFAGLSTSGEFRRFVFSLNRDDLLGRLTTYYSDVGSWGGVEAGLAEGLPAPPNPRMHMRGPGMFTLIDATGRVIVGGPGYRPGELLTGQTLRSFDPIEVEGATVGWLVVPGDAFAESGGESLFFRRVNNTLLLAAIGAFGVALLAGALAARSLTRPLRELTAATQAVAAGDFERKVEVGSRDELGALAAAFNRMSQALAESQRLRRQMTADVAHELRTPLAVILGHVDAVEDGVLPEPAGAMRIIREETERLSRLVEDLRTLTRADAGELALLRQPIELDDLVQHVVSAYLPQARAKQIELQAEDASASAAVEVDRDRMVQVISNLLSNALFHTPTGGKVVVRCEPIPSGARISIHDSGPGIPPEDLARIFDRFYRTDKSRRREDGGSGLGLAIARSIVEAHGGRIWAESPPGEGATISIDLPRKSGGETS
jgi:signal transduction histidine kinase